MNLNCSWSLCEICNATNGKCCVLSANTQAIYINQITSHLIYKRGWRWTMATGAVAIALWSLLITLWWLRELSWMTERIKCDSSKIPLKLFVGYKLWMNIERILFSFIFGWRFSFSSIMYYIKFNGHSKLTENEITESSSNSHTYLLLRNSQPFIALDKIKFVRIIFVSYHNIWLLAKKLLAYGSSNYIRFAIWNLSNFLHIICTFCWHFKLTILRTIE